MKILYLTQYFNFPDEPGASRHYQSARAWAAQGHEVSVLTGNVNYKSGETFPSDRFHTFSTFDHPDGFRLRRLWTYSRFRGSFRKRLLFFGSFAAHASMVGSWMGRPDIVFASSTPLTVGVPGWFLARRFGCPFVFELRDLWPEAAVAAGVMTHPGWVDRAQRLARFLYRRSDHLIAVTEGIEAGLLAHGVPEARVTLIPNGVDHWMRPEDFADQNPLTRFGDRFVCVYVGAHGVWNDLGTLLAAARELADDPRFCFVFIGDGDDRPRLEATARRWGLHNTHFLGALPKEQAFAAMVHADVGLISASGHEHNRQTLPNKIFDYMAAEIPVLVAAGEGEMAELLARSGGGWMSPPEDGAGLAANLRRCHDLAEDERRAMGTRGRAYVMAHYSRPQLAAKATAVFAGLLGHVVPGRMPTDHSDEDSEKDPPVSGRSKQVGGEPF